MFHDLSSITVHIGMQPTKLAPAVSVCSLSLSLSFHLLKELWPSVSFIKVSKSYVVRRKS